MLGGILRPILWWALVGSAVAGWFGRKRLHRLEIEDLSVSVLHGATAFCAGEPTLMVVGATLADGEVLDTAGTSGLRLRDFELSLALGDRGGPHPIDLLADGGFASIDGKGVMFVENRGLDLLDRTLRIEARGRRTDDVASAELQPTFGCPVVLDYRGSGMPGATLHGSRPASFLPQGTRGGAAGESGDDGAPGQDGAPGTGGRMGAAGASGHDLVVALGPVAQADGTPLVLAVISGNTVPLRTVLMDPAAGGTLHLVATGAAGGSGGSGGSGGDGGDGDEAHPAGGHGAHGGPGGSGGPGGRGGHVLVQVDARDPELVQWLTVSVEGGVGGAAGSGGSGGRGGSGHDGAASGADGSAGASGQVGSDGADGQVVVEAVPPEALFGVLPR